jgi:DNA repair protein RadC
MAKDLPSDTAADEATDELGTTQIAPPRLDSDSRAVAMRPARRRKAPNQETLYLASLITMADVSADAIEAARRVLCRHGSLAAIFRMSGDELAEDVDLGYSGAANIEVVRRIIHKDVFGPLRTRPVFENFDMLERYLKSRIGHSATEQCRLLSLDVRGALIADKLLAFGTDSFVGMDVKTIISEALTSSAHRFIVVHNHPSGNHLPSQEDETMTAVIWAASQVVGLNFADHIIVTAERTFSFRMAGRLRPKRRDEVVEEACDMGGRLYGN